jgi:hypothetical protein
MCPMLGPDVAKMTIKLKALMKHSSVPIKNNKIGYSEHDIS